MNSPFRLVESEGVAMISYPLGDSVQNSSDQVHQRKTSHEVSRDERDHDDKTDEARIHDGSLFLRLFAETCPSLSSGDVGNLEDQNAREG